MNDKVGLLSYRMDRDQFEKPYSDETARMIDQEVRGGRAGGPGFLHRFVLPTYQWIERPFRLAWPVCSLNTVHTSCLSNIVLDLEGTKPSPPCATAVLAQFM